MNEAEIEAAVRKVIGGIDWHEVFDVPSEPPAHDDLLHVGVRKRIADALESVDRPKDV